jgi:hypothetical protein
MTSARKKCKVCNKKVGINGYECKCDTSAVFCDTHKYTFAHECVKSNFDSHKKHLIQTLIKVSADKIADRA